MVLTRMLITITPLANPGERLRPVSEPVRTSCVCIIIIRIMLGCKALHSVCDMEEYL